MKLGYSEPTAVRRPTHRDHGALVVVAAQSVGCPSNRQSTLAPVGARNATRNREMT
jgi:hypothetical protein